MKFGYVKSATFTPELKVGDVDFNAQKIIDGIDEAYSRGVELLVFPKLSISGCTCSDLFFSKTILTSFARVGFISSNRSVTSL